MGSRVAGHGAAVLDTSHFTDSIEALDETLRLYAVVRGDLKMPPGKAAAQSGHAFLEAFLTCEKERPATAAAYAADPPGTKVVLLAKNLYELERARDECASLGIPHALITDSGHVLPPYFTGDPIITALGFGPATRDEVGQITRRLALVR